MRRTTHIFIYIIRYVAEKI